MEEIILKVKTRKESGKENKKLRREEKIPAVVYGHGFKNINVFVDKKNFEGLYEKTGESSLIDLIVDEGKPIKCLIQDIQTHPTTDEFIHIDFHTVKMTEKITTEVVINFMGEAPAIKEMGGVLIRALDKIEVECLPGDLVHEIEVDLSLLKTFDDIIYIKDLKIPEKIKVLEKDDEVVAKAQPPRTEEELKALEEDIEEKVNEVEGVKEEEGEESASAESTADEKVAPKDEKEQKGDKPASAKASVGKDENKNEG